MPETLQPLAVELRDINSIQPYEHNPRINDNAVDAVSLKPFRLARQPDLLLLSVLPLRCADSNC
jgi:hypothetical protein